MNPDAIALFRELADQLPSEREDYFARHHVPAALRTEVESLLRFDGETADTLRGRVIAAAQVLLHESGALEPHPHRATPFGETTPPRHLSMPSDIDERPSLSGALLGGRYSVVSLLGSGGMGDVYLAERHDGEIQQKVAIKFLHSGAERSSWLRRFLRERQLLASLNHPSIARVIDAGRAERRPYLVMEYIDGVPIDVYARGRSLRDQLSVFIAVCAAVTHAHRHLIMHRDLKPSNILVDASGHPTLLDFGIAKVLDDEDDQTRTIERLLTPDFASPEQRRGALQTTATDIYSLGVVLYKMVTGRLPHAPSTQTDDLSDHENHGSTDASQLNPTLPRDLDFVLRKALRDEPEERYASVEAFAEDIQALLAGRPIQARSADIWYRGRKWLRRAWIPVSAASVTIAALSVGLYVANRERLVAERRFEQVRSLANSVLAMENRMRGVAGFLKPRMDLAALSQEYLEALTPAAAGDPQLMLEIAQAYLRLARIQGGPLPSNLGLTEQAHRNLRTASALIDSVLAVAPENQEALLASAQINEGLMRFAEMAGQVDAALEHGRRAAEQLEGLLRVSQRARDPLRPTVDYYNIVANVARTHGGLGDPQSAIRYARRAREVARSLLSSDAHVAQASGYLADLLRQSGDLDGALHEIQQARDSLARATFASQVTRRSTAFSVLMSHAAILGARFNNLERRDEAATVLQEALVFVDDWAQQDPDDVPSRVQIGNAAHDLGGLLRDRDPADALGVYDHALGRLREIANNTSLRREEAKVLAASSYPLRRLNQTAEAAQRIDRALSLLEQTKTKFGRRNAIDFDPANAAIVVRSAVADHYAAIGQTTRAANVFQELLADVLTGASEPRRLLSHATTLSNIYAALATLHARNGDAEPAAAAATQRRELWQHWASQLPNSGFVRKQLAAASVE